MNKIKIVSLSILTLASIGLLAGCGKQPVTESAPIIEVQDQQQATTVVATTTEEKIDLDAETKALDETIKEIDKSGFEQTDLSDKDLGL